MDNIVLGKDGLIDRYIDQDQLDQFEHIAKTENHIALLKGFKAYEESILPFFEKDPITNREEFMRIFRQLWIHEITSFYLGLYTTDPESIEIISSLRGSESAQHVATSLFLPKLYDQVSKQTGIDVDLLKYALPDEMLSLQFDREALALRRTLYVIEDINGSMKLLVGEDAQQYTQDFLKNVAVDVVDAHATECKGSSAFAGKVKGRVVVIIHEQDLAKVRDGDILVSPMTRTSFIHAMNKAAAFVTDEGGVTCHAAIIAREMKKPCVVGTKIATRVLKDDDVVEVDAMSGIVAVITRA